MFANAIGGSPLSSASIVLIGNIVAVAVIPAVLVVLVDQTFLTVRRIAQHMPQFVAAGPGD
jgi:hypothetical protein